MNTYIIAHTPPQAHARTVAAVLHNGVFLDIDGSWMSSLDDANHYHDLRAVVKIYSHLCQTCDAPGDLHIIGIASHARSIIARRHILPQPARA